MLVYDGTSFQNGGTSEGMLTHVASAKLGAEGAPEEITALTWHNSGYVLVGTNAGGGRRGALWGWGAGGGCGREGCVLVSAGRSEQGPGSLPQRSMTYDVARRCPALAAAAGSLVALQAARSKPEVRPPTSCWLSPARTGCAQRMPLLATATRRHRRPSPPLAAGA